MSDDPFERAAKHERSVEAARASFRVHFGVYLAVQVMLFVIWAFTPHQRHVLPWFLYPLMGWGIGIVAHYLAVRGWIRAGAPKTKGWYDHPSDQQRPAVRGPPSARRRDGSPPRRSA